MPHTPVSPSVINFLRTTSDSLGVLEKRKFIAKSVTELFGGVARRAAALVGWNRNTIIRALKEQQQGNFVEGRKGAAGRKRAEHFLPHLLQDIRSLCSDQSQTDPTFYSDKLYTRLSAPAVARLLVTVKGYDPATVPNEDTILIKMRQLGFYSRRVRKVVPKKNTRNQRDLRANEYGS